MIFLDENKTFKITPRSNTFNTLKFRNESTSEVTEVVNYTSTVTDYGVQIIITETFDVDTYYTLEVINGSTERITQNDLIRVAENGDTRVSENSLNADTVVYKGKVFSTDRPKENYSVNNNDYIFL
jgi:hypothetical protein